MLLLAVTPHAVALFGALAPFGIVSYAVFVGLGYSWLKRQKKELRFGTGLFLGHWACLLPVSAANVAALHGMSPLPPTEGALLLLRLLVVAGVALLALACVPLATWIAMVRETKLLWLYSAIAGALAWCLRFPFQSMWDASSTAPGRMLQVAAFEAVQVVLRFFLPNIQVDPDTFVIRAPNFAIFVAEQCSGLEGLGLVLVFTTIWLWYFRRESRFPQAILLIPCALGFVWMLNVVRIAALVLIGNAGYGEIAMVGFHSQAGWIAFTTVAFGFSMATRNLRWVRKIPDGSAGELAAELPAAGEPHAQVDETGESPATAAYLVPFLAMLGASFFSKAASGHFEWLYPIRTIAGLVAICVYWPELKKIGWRFGWLAPVAGAGIFGVWLLPSLLGASQSNSLGESLAALSPAARWSWIVFRVAAAVVVAPIAEELAFRGYLARRLVWSENAREFDTVPFSSVTLLSVGLSSVAFGLMYGRQWMLGVLAGLVFAGVMKWRGRLSDAIVAHAAGNLLLAIWVLSRGNWAQW